MMEVDQNGDPMSSPTSFIMIAIIALFVLWAVWIQVRTRRREKAVLEANERPTGPSGADPMTSDQKKSDLVASKHMLRSMTNFGWRGNGYNSP